MQELKVYGSTASSVEVVLVTGVMNTFVVVCWFDKTCVAEYTDDVCSAWRSGSLKQLLSVFLIGCVRHLP